MHKKKKSVTCYLKWVDPFTYVDLLLFKLFDEPDTTQKKILFWIIYIAFAFIFAYLLYRISGLILNNTTPFATVVSASMEPRFYRGDVVILTAPKNLKATTATIDINLAEKDLKEFAELSYKINEYGLEQIDSIKIGDTNIAINDIYSNDIIVYHSNIRGIDIIHRIVAYIHANDGNFIITKGDNNKTNRIIDEDCNIDRETGIPQNACLNIYPIPVDKIKGKMIGKVPYIGYAKLFLFG